MTHLEVLENKLHSKMDAFAGIFRTKENDSEEDMPRMSVIQNLGSSGAIMAIAGFVVSVSEFCVYCRTGNSATLQNSFIARDIGVVGLGLCVGSFGDIGGLIRKRLTGS